MFKSFFAFLKQKPFITKVKLNFLKNFYLNPKPYTFSQIVDKSKKYTQNALNNFFVPNSTISYVSKLKLKYLLFKKNNLKKKKITFLLFKHKIFNYTTPKLIIFKKPNKINMKSNEFRTNINFFDNKVMVSNISTFSTYN
jgi:hypothetical protein